MRKLLKRLIYSLGWETISRNAFGRDIYQDIRQIIGNENLTLFDVGANVGQTIQAFQEKFNTSEIHAFEPGSLAFSQLSSKFSSVENVTVNMLALGSTTEKKTFHENTYTEMSSFLQLGDIGWGRIQSLTEVPVMRGDEYCMSKSITKIDLLKIDTQGFDFEVIKGFSAMLEVGAVHIVYFEVTFMELYDNLPNFGEIYQYLTSFGFHLVSFYGIGYRDNRAFAGDVVFALTRNSCSNDTVIT
jgi:FkbM family methyltransferase